MQDSQGGSAPTSLPPLSLEVEPGAAAAPASDVAQRLRTAFEAASDDSGIRAELVEQDGGWRYVFADKAGAAGGLIGQAFRDELAADGVHVGETLRPGRDLSTAQVERGVGAIRRAFQRLQALLVQHNTFYRGGLAFPFPASTPGFGDKGIVAVRFPLAAQADVVIEESGVAIRFAPGELGAVTSCGFYVPVWVEGDFSATIEFEYRRWRPSPRDASCFALLSSDEEVPERFHAQRMSTGDGPHYGLAEIRGVVSPMQELQHDRGGLRIVREGATVRCLHRGGDGPWVELGSGRGPVSPVQLLGAKIWGKVDCDGLEVALTRFDLEGKVSSREIAPLPDRLDPRDLEDAPGAPDLKL